MCLIKDISKVLDVDEKIRVINYCEFEFGDNYAPIWRKSEVDEMIAEEGFTEEEVEEYLPKIENDDFILIQGRSFEGCNKNYIHHEFKQQIKQNLSHEGLKEELIDVLIEHEDVDELINRIEEE